MVISFPSVLPPARFDGEQWTQARIEESATADGPWTLVETVPFTSYDRDPARPALRGVSTSLGTLDEGWYRVVVIDDDGDEYALEPVAHNASADIRPTVDDVAALVPTYTVAAFGAAGSGTELGTFTEDTSPTDAQVEQLIDQAIGDLTSQVGDVIPASWTDEARRLVTLRAAALVITSRSDEENEPARHPYLAMYLSGVEALRLRLVSPMVY